MKKIITISREFGSGGRVIGEALAKELGFSFFDKEIIKSSLVRTSWKSITASTSSLVELI